MSKRDLVKYARELVMAGVGDIPPWLYALMRTPPLPVKPLRKGRPPPIKFPEDSLIDAYYRRHPEARLEAIDLASFEPPTGRRFALRQLELMSEEGGGLSKIEASIQVEKEFSSRQEAAAAATGVRQQSIIEQIQAEEERHLQQALRQYATSHGPTTVRQHAQELWQQQHTRKPAAGAQLGKQQPIAKQALVRRQAKEPWKQPKQASKAAATGNGTAAPAAAATAGAAS
ncbi:hypothetical protein CHLNCDRAFT_143448 [Chlorella variabilis]|uniref:Small ribosomal subunit protein mS23 n=1 Tax=Chlorella variabilis TaxID=554065 RepID=E1ZAX9_CHLVA|nr:hypothetical protein CHLNCDRAFT_143448 [Chlorella variabilis]EFN56928.1 hypothetical protein CHLNCDRAFT_143448 [Chlorella variabilis]|eukprot:XP_005849030.1 hypothetical protein CHLNCDRAFT_143448 [Chlorella variabilis]